ncbi:MAG: hypothetical protein WCK67_08045 [bacterium]
MKDFELEPEETDEENIDEDYIPDYEDERASLLRHDDYLSA